MILFLLPITFFYEGNRRANEYCWNLDRSSIPLRYACDRLVLLQPYQKLAIEVYGAPGANGSGLLVIQNGSDYGYVSLSRIAAIYFGADSVYNPNITYLSPPDPYSPGCDTDYILAVQSSMSIGDQVSFGAATNTTGSGEVYINEPGIMVLSDGLGNTPIFLFTPQIRYMVKDSLPLARMSGETEQVKQAIKVTIQNNH